MKSGLSEHILDIRWFKPDIDGDKTTSAPIETGSSFWESIYTITTCLAGHTLEPDVGCTSDTVHTKIATVILPPINEPPYFRTPCPSNIEVTTDQGQRGKQVRRHEPKAYPMCRGAVTR